MRDGTSFWAMTAGPHKEMMLGLLGDGSLVWPSDPCHFDTLDEVDSGLDRLTYLNSADVGHVSVTQVRDLVWGRFARGCACVEQWCRW